MATASPPGRAPLWPRGRESARSTVALGAALCLSLVVLDLLLGRELGLFFDLCFVTLCGWLAVVVRAGELFTVGVLPPLLMVGVFVLLGIAAPEIVARPQDGVVQATVTGLAGHAVALVAGYAAALVVLAVRTRALAEEQPGGRAGTRVSPAVRRAGSPRPS